ncbi:kinase-like domain [Fusarium acutatum]|uniref:Kinase-like domain n=1 Tax=Fusarium acutatum TaxID=78861 RepID=A0A8H4NDL7_9HYPO|nr:kinase-like domain [Fusarium acutatum]
MSSESRPSTPPHHPNFGVRMSRESIERLVRHILPDTTHIEVEALPSFKSFNNRIYYLQYHKESQNGNDASHVDELVLKINGRGFGSEKVQNEVSCLHLLEHFCPDIPAPRTIAWSQDGLAIDAKDARDGEVKLNGVDETLSGWILMTRVLGKPIDLSALSNDDKFHLATQLADYVTNWRRNVPPQSFAGNISFHQMYCQPEIKIPSSNSANEMQFLIRGMLGEELHCQDGIASLAEYYKLRIKNKMGTLVTNKTFAPNRDLIQPLETFIQQGLPALRALNTRDDSFVFTHYDLSPRNILVSGQPPQITGIVDFEFSGFFPPLDEFLNDCIANNGDWPKDMYEAYLKRLECNGIPTPLGGIEKDYWEEMALLEELVEKIAPWWLPGEFHGEQLEQELNKVKSRELLWTSHIALIADPGGEASSNNIGSADTFLQEREECNDNDDSPSAGECRLDERPDFLQNREQSVNLVVQGLLRAGLSGIEFSVIHGTEILVMLS